MNLNHSYFDASIWNDNKVQYKGIFKIKYGIFISNTVKESFTFTAPPYDVNLRMNHNANKAILHKLVNGIEPLVLHETSIVNDLKFLAPLRGLKSTLNKSILA